MPVGFTATLFSVVVERGVQIISLGAPSVGEDDFYLMLQHKDEHSLQDAKLGMDKPYIDYCGQGWSWYGHIDKFELSHDRVRVRMDTEAAAHMRNDGHIEVRFTLDDDQYAELRSALRRTFNGCGYYRDEG